jgi:Spy/CpxP family protein refolding chaperone
MKKVTLAALAALLVLGGVGAAYAWGPGWGKMNVPWAYGEAPCHPGAIDLDLSEEQAKKLQDLKLEVQKEMLDVKSSLKAKALELQTLLLSKEPDQAKVSSLLEEIGQIRTDMQKKAVDYQIEMREILTEEQWNKLSSCRYFGGGAGRGRQFGSGYRGMWDFMP